MSLVEKKNVVDGEASESDSDDNGKVQGKVVEGEAAESDDEIFSFSSNRKTIIDNAISENIYSPPIKQNSYPESLLAKKLYESNYSFFNHLNVFIQTTILSGIKQIASSDQLLLKSQITLQSAHASIQKVNENTSAILEKYQNVLAGDFIPNIRIPQK